MLTKTEQDFYDKAYAKAKKLGRLFFEEELLSQGWEEGYDLDLNLDDEKRFVGTSLKAVDSNNFKMRLWMLEEWLPLNRQHRKSSHQEIVSDARKKAEVSQAYKDRRQKYLEERRPYAKTSRNRDVEEVGVSVVEKNVKPGDKPLRGVVVKVNGDKILLRDDEQWYLSQAFVRDVNV
jgi:hypothetical protein